MVGGGAKLDNATLDEIEDALIHVPDLGPADSRDASGRDWRTSGSGWKSPHREMREGRGGRNRRDFAPGRQAARNHRLPATCRMILGDRWSMAAARPPPSPSSPILFTEDDYGVLLAAGVTPSAPLAIGQLATMGGTRRGSIWCAAPEGGRSGGDRVSMRSSRRPIPEIDALIVDTAGRFAEQKRN